MGLPIYLSRRLSLSSGGRKSSPAVRVATVAVALAVAVMIISISIVIGFKREITERVTGFNADIVLTALPSYNENGEAVEDNLVTLTPTLKKILTDLPFVTDVALQVNLPSILKTPDNFKGVYLKPLAGQQVKGFVSSALEEGKLPDNDSSILISRNIADALSLKTGDHIPTYFMTNTIDVSKMRISGIYNSHFDDYDDNFAFTTAAPLIARSGISQSQATAILVSVDDFSGIDEYTAIIQSAITQALKDELIYKPLRVTNARYSGAAYFHWLDMLDTNVWVILILMTVVSCVTLISSMLIMMVDKVRFIALMSALGASRRLLGRVFVMLAIRVAILGLLIGDILGVGLVLLQKYTLWLPLDPDSYYIDFVPVAVNWYAFLALNIGVLVVTFLMLLLPSRYVGRFSPARVLVRE